MQAKHFWTEEQKTFVRENIKGRQTTELLIMVNERFETNLKINQLRAFIKNNKLKSGLSTTFKSGEPSWNKGMKGLDIGGKETRFKKGDIPDNYAPIGTQRVNKDGYVMVKVSDEGPYQLRWKLLQRILWEKEHGPIPANHVLIFLDGNKENVALDNLMLITRGDLARMNHEDLFYKNEKLTKAAVNLVKIKRKVFDLEIRGGDDEEFAKHVIRAGRNGISESAFMARLNRGWDLEDAVNKPLHTKVKRRRREMA